MLTLFEALVVFTVIIAILILFRNQQAKEQANHIAKKFCQRNALQFLDGTVAMKGMGFSHSFPALTRRFRFEYSTDKVDRHTGYVAIIGRQIQSIYVDPSHLPEENTDHLFA